MKSLSVLPTVVPWDLPQPDTHASSNEYRRALSAIYAFSETPRSAAEVRLARQRKLDRMRTLLDLLGSPQAGFQTILVAGTKGKGSTAALLTSILHVAGYRVGRYTQPHLYSYRERTWARGRYIEEDELVDAMNTMGGALRAVKHYAELGPLTTFDVGTALSLLHFARRQVEVAVVEVGVGGANDATNALEPVLAVIGPISLDHEEALGNDLLAIAREKAGVLRRGIDAVVARQEACVAEAIRETAAVVGARIFDAEAGKVGADGACSLTVAGPEGEITGLSMPLAGSFQRQNASMAVAAAQLLARRGWHVGESAIRDGLAHVHWPGRFQTVVRDPLTIVDGAHNPCAARALAETMRTTLPERPLTLVLGMSQDKDIPSTVGELAPLANRVIVTRARHQRSCEPAQLADIVRSAAPTLDPIVASSPQEAVELAWASTPPNGATVVTGSLFLVGDVLEWLLP